MAKHAAAPSRSPWRPFALAVVASLVLAGTGSGVLALLRAQATATQGVATGTLQLVLERNGTFGTTVSGVAPGDTVHRFVTVTNSGSLAAAGLAFSATATGSPELTTANPSGTALRVSVTACSGTWSALGSEGLCNAPNAAPGTTGTGTRTVLLNDVAVQELASTRDLIARTTVLPAGHVHHLRITLAVPSVAAVEVSSNGTPGPGSVQGKSATLSFTFAEDQRAGTVTAG